MVADSPVDAFGSDASGLRALLVKTVLARHALAAEAHTVSESRYAMGFGTQWRDMLEDVREALKERGFRSCKLAPGGHEIPVVSNCLVYVWRMPNNPNAVTEFGSSATRRNGFLTPPLDPVLWEPSLSKEQAPAHNMMDEGEVGPVLQALGDRMPLVLVMVGSTPRQLRSIEWAVAMLDGKGKVELRGQEAIWKPESVADGNASGVEPFDSGSPVVPNVEVREQQGSGPHA